MEVLLPRTQFMTWYKNTELEKIDDGAATVMVANSYAKSWLEAKNRKQILDAIKKIAPEVKTIEFKVKGTKPMGRLELEIKAKPGEKHEGRMPSLNAYYTFDNFVVGNNNSLAYAVAKEVGTNPGKKHNPLFIYGGVGLGKTHLAQAIGQEVLRANGEAKVVYASCETFTNDFIQAIASKRMAQFKKNYREVDVLIVDDVQFLSAKEGSQQEFFHTYNDLHQNSRQIILTADKIPQAIPALEGRLVSRFGSGMVVDIQPPDYETRIAILREKCKEKNYFVEEGVLEYIAKNIFSNIRELEGALNRLATYCQLNDVRTTIDTATEVLKDFISSTNKSIDSAEIISAVCKHFSIQREDLLGKTRVKEFILPRQIAIYLIREQTNKSLPEIGRILGGKDHTTILYAERKIANDIKSNSTLKSDIEKIRNLISAID